MSYSLKRISGIQLITRPLDSLYSLSVSRVTKEGALKIYTRASVFDDGALANDYVVKAALVPVHQIPVDILRQIPATALSTLVSLQAL